MKKQTMLVAAFVTAIVGADTFGFVVDRPVLYRAEFLPVAGEVYSLVAEGIAWEVLNPLEGQPA